MNAALATLGHRGGSITHFRHRVPDAGRVQHCSALGSLLMLIYNCYTQSVCVAVTAQVQLVPIVGVVGARWLTIFILVVPDGRQTISP
jgi:hypothetical protein